MTNTPASQYDLSIRERVLLLLDESPLNALYRIAIGYAIPSLYSRISSRDSSEWFLVLWFICALIALRVIPAMLRKLLHFSEEIKKVWMKRRMLTKLYDSYQWKKLTWFGTGLAGFVATSKVWNGPACALAVLCLLSGGIGAFIWQKRTAEGIPLSIRSDVWNGSDRRV